MKKNLNGKELKISGDLSKVITVIQEKTQNYQHQTGPKVQVQHVTKEREMMAKVIRQREAEQHNPALRSSLDLENF